MMQITQRARIALVEVLADHEDCGVRIWVDGHNGSCAKYGMDIDCRIHSTDKVIEGPGYKIIIDSYNLGYLEGCTLDYQDTLINGGFKIIDENSGGCQCGSFNCQCG